MKRLLILMLCLLLLGCQNREPAPPEDFWVADETGEPEPTDTAEPTVFTLPYLSSQSLNPITCSDGVQQTMGSLLYEGLFTLDRHFTPQNVLCASYTQKDLSYTFTLRAGVTFTDGSPLTPADVVATYRRAQISERYAARFRNVVAMRAGSDAVTLTLSRADSALPALLDIPIVKSGTDKYPVPVGTGPYCFASDETVDTLVRNESWWGDGTGLPERIALVAAKDEDAAAYLFTAGRAHLLVADLLGDSAAASIGGADLTDAPTSTLYYIGFNVKSGATADRALRAAIHDALDRDTIVATSLAGHAQGARFPISPSSPLYPTETGIAPAAAASPAVDAALTLLVNEESSCKTALGEHIAKALTEEGFAVSVTALSWEDYYKALKSRDFNLYLGEVRLTADWNLAPLIGTGGALNYGGFSDAATDAALAAFLADETAETAAALCARLTERVPITPIAFKSVSVLTSAGQLDGLAPTASHPLNGLARWRFHFE